MTESHETKHTSRPVLLGVYCRYMLCTPLFAGALCLLFFYFTYPGLAMLSEILCRMYRDKGPMIIIGIVIVCWGAFACVFCFFLGEFFLGSLTKRIGPNELGAYVRGWWEYYENEEEKPHRLRIIGRGIMRGVGALMWLSLGTMIIMAIPFSIGALFSRIFHTSLGYLICPVAVVIPGLRGLNESGLHFLLGFLIHRPDVAEFRGRWARDSSCWPRKLMVIAANGMAAGMDEFLRQAWKKKADGAVLHVLVTKDNHPVCISRPPSHVRSVEKATLGEVEAPPLSEVLRNFRKRKMAVVNYRGGVKGVASIVKVLNESELGVRSYWIVSTSPKILRHFRREIPSCRCVLELSPIEGVPMHDASILGLIADEKFSGVCGSPALTNRQLTKLCQKQGAEYILRDPPLSYARELASWYNAHMVITDSPQEIHNI